jgi:hypothetical protein
MILRINFHNCVFSGFESTYLKNEVLWLMLYCSFVNSYPDSVLVIVWVILPINRITAIVMMPTVVDGIRFIAGEYKTRPRA